MLGLMQHWPLTVDKIPGPAADRHGRRELVTRSLEGPIARGTCADARTRATVPGGSCSGLPRSASRW